MADEDTPKMTREDAILERMAGRPVEIPGEEPQTDGGEARENLGDLADEQAADHDGEGHGGQTLPDGSTPTLGADVVDPDLDLSQDAGSATQGGLGSDVTPGDTPEAVMAAAEAQTGAGNGEPLPEDEGTDATGDGAADDAKAEDETSGAEADTKE
jgi:hypothetical protein